MSEFFTLDFAYARNLEGQKANQNNFYGSIRAKESKESLEAQRLLEGRKGAGNDALGWLDLASDTTQENLNNINNAAKIIQKTEALAIIGIGGSYLGAKAVISALQGPFETSTCPIYFLGYNIDASYHKGLIDILSRKRYAINIISKSGTTIEVALAFRFLWQDLKSRFSSEELRDLVFVTTDAKKGKLRQFIQKHQLRNFIIPKDIGGRYSVLSPVGLLPIASAGLSITKVLKGACEMREKLRSTDFNSNPALQYAAYRKTAYRLGKKIEIFCTYQQNLFHLCEWWKQLFGESEGKNHTSIFPAIVNFTTDLHSMGQWIQEGERNIFETVLDVESVAELIIPDLEDNNDGLNYLSGKSLHYVNRSATEASLMAHKEGGVPCLRIRIPKLDEETIGALLYFFEYSCAISAYMFKVNPFDQPGVEAYKGKMSKILA